MVVCTENSWFIAAVELFRYRHNKQRYKLEEISEF